MTDEERREEDKVFDDIDVVEEPPISLLKPKSREHEKLLQFLLKRLEMSERNMANFYDRWQANERRVQAYVSLKDWEQELREANNSGEAPKVTSVVIPYSYATIATVVTYLVHTFTGRKPMFQVGTYKDKTQDGARKLEKVLQYNADHTRMIRHLFQHFYDGELYGVGALRTNWKEDWRMRTVWKEQSASPFMRFLGGQAGKRYAEKEERRVYAGNETNSIDPFMFFPDPRVPMTEVNRRGEFVFWRTFEGRHTLKLAEADGELQWVDKAEARMPQNKYGNENSVRNLMSSGEAHPGAQNQEGARDFYQVDQGTVWIIPREFGIGDSDRPELWMFTILNKSQIVQAEPADYDHGMHPVAVSEPYTMGYGFGNPALADYLGPMQDTLSWLINSHMDNVRTALNNMFIVDPSRVEIQDLKEPGAGKLVRLKSSAYGSDVRSALTQMQVHDVTGKHVQDFELFMKMGDALSSVTDNLRGVQDHGGRKTATEVRTSGEAAASRLASHARLISSQSIVDLTEQMCLNIQQYLDDDFHFQITGEESPIHIAPEMLVGDFYYPVHDGTLPIDKVAMLDVWKEILMGVMQDQELRQQYSVPKIFEHVAELGGAKNLEQFKMMQDDQLERQVQAGNVASMEEVMSAMGSGTTPGVQPNPAGRMAGGI